MTFQAFVFVQALVNLLGNERHFSCAKRFCLLKFEDACCSVTNVAFDVMLVE